MPRNMLSKKGPKDLQKATKGSSGGKEATTMRSSSWRPHYNKETPIISHLA